MIRRKAALVGTGDQGFVLGWLIKKSADGSESMVMVFEHDAQGPDAGKISEQPIANIKFMDGAPEVIVPIV